MARSEVLARERAARVALREAVDDLRAAQVAAGAAAPAPRWWRWAAVVAVVVSVVAAGWGVARWAAASGRITDAGYERAATDRVTLLLSPDYRQPGRAQRILAGATGEFYDEFAQSADAYTRFVAARGTVAEGLVDGAAISGRTEAGATVLVAATVRFTGPDTGANTTGQTTPGSDGGGTATGDPDSGGTGDRTQRFRLRVLLTDSDGGPKLAAVQYLP
ncbi:hypothetical protein GII33_17555 [Gordonia pseudamarae]|uniref:hypothetical protein n=1 Tax=Gordonia TaxID=2053 RepID=UPI0019CCA3EE|nr:MULTISPECIES: hypothetical protein [Gordonia]MBD0021123.1 hypothetical protein [Gordonia sp. (in: high G+C Gram-positive bacteria)]QHN27495.1 hypothetical protein GII33_17555 [Gordonia pseudamarae]